MDFPSPVSLFFLFVPLWLSKVWKDETGFIDVNLEQREDLILCGTGRGVETPRVRRVVVMVALMDGRGRFATSSGVHGDSGEMVTSCASRNS
jgi:hypothetical protein